VTATTTGYVKNIKDLAAYLTSLGGVGQEVLITNAILTIQTQQSTATLRPHRTTTLVVVSDAAITDGDGGSETLDVALDARCTGDVEFKIVSDKCSRYVSSDGTAYQRVQETVIDITAVLQKLATQLSKRAIFPTDPYMALVLVIKSAAEDVYYYYDLKIAYMVRAKPLRTLQ
jgi:hypothetical protein